MKNIRLFITLMLTVLLLSACSNSGADTHVNTEQEQKEELLAQITTEVSATVAGYVKSKVVAVEDADALISMLVSKAEKDAKAAADLAALAAEDAVAEVPVVTVEEKDGPSLYHRARGKLVKWSKSSVNAYQDVVTSIAPEAEALQVAYEAMVRAQVIYKLKNPDATEEDVARVFPNPTSELDSIKANLFADLK